MPIVVAMGGNSLLDPKSPPSLENQFASTRRSTDPIARLIGRGEHLVLTHGNGPQVGFMQLRSELARREVHEVPLDSLVADSQGALGYMIARCLNESLVHRGVAAEVATIVTQVEVDPNDPALDHPTKPVGRFYVAPEAEALQRERGWQMVEDSQRGYRRVVPSPVPVAIVELATIARLVAAGVTVIACGGGGIPVARGTDGRMTGLEAVIDKDRASALLATHLGARRMLVTTAVDAVYRDFSSPDRIPMRTTTVAELRGMLAKKQFPPGSMGPKVEASIAFLENGGEEVTICSPESLVEAYEGEAGTCIRRE